MEGSIISEQEIQLQAEQPPNPESHTAKKGKSLHKTVVTVKVVACGGKQRNEGPPSDSWSWRKYGQKPIKGSPYPRGYYRCSTSKGCSAKKQVERCRTDASMLIITYTSSHNHTGPNFHNSINLTSHTPQMKVVSLLEMGDEPKLKQPELEEEEEQQQQEQNSTEHFHYFEPPQEVSNHIDHNPFSVDLDSGQESLGILFDEELISYPPIRTSEKQESDEYDFFDELEELPMSSLPFRSFMTSSFHSDRILVQPS